MRVKVEKIEDETVKLLWEIEDSGVGIPQDKWGKIFGSFEQVDSSDTRDYGGSGLGLTISRQLARKMGGDITVSSKIGVGSIFRCSMVLSLVAADDSIVLKEDVHAVRSLSHNT